MTKNLVRGIIICVVALMVLNVASASYAQDMGTKLSRGLINILTGWMEIPSNIYTTSVESNPFYGMTMGLARGVGMTFVRTGCGIYETVTFPIQIPQEGYAPMLEPEYVFKPNDKSGDKSDTTATENK